MRGKTMKVMNLVLSIAGIGMLLATFRGVLRADLPGHSYTLELGPGNEDAKRIIESHILGRFLSRKEFQKNYQALKPAELVHRDFRGAVFHLRLGAVCKIKFDGCDFTNADGEETYFVGCSFRGAILRNVKDFWIDKSCDLTDADLRGSEFFPVHKGQLTSTLNYKQKDLSHISLGGNLTGVSFKGFKLRRTRFTGNILGCDFTGADIRGCSFMGPFSPDYFLKPITEQKIHRVISPEQLYSTASYRDRDLTGVGFSHCDLRDFDFSWQSLGIFSGCDLRGANFQNAWFAYYDRYRSTGFSKCILSKEQFYSTRNYKFKKFPRGFILTYMDLRGWDFSGLKLWGVDFRGSRLDGANLEDAEGGDFRFAKGLTVEQIRSLKLYKQRRFHQLKIPPELEKKLRPEMQRLRRRRQRGHSFREPLLPVKYAFGMPLNRSGSTFFLTGFPRLQNRPFAP